MGVSGRYPALIELLAIDQSDVLRLAVHGFPVSRGRENRIGPTRILKFPWGISWRNKRLFDIGCDALSL